MAAIHPQDPVSGNDQLFAVIDLGSNSFHMIIAEFGDGSFRQIGKLKEKVQLASGLSAAGILSAPAIDRGLECLARFADRLQALPADNVRVVGTYTLREARNAEEFLTRAEALLGCGIEVVSGQEEARLIFSGVAHYHPDLERALVVDIGGGSTELVIGKHFEAIRVDSLALGCITAQKFFPDGHITASGFRGAIEQARVQLAPITRQYRQLGWQQAIGCSGTIQSIHQVLSNTQSASGPITAQGLSGLAPVLIEQGHADRLELPGLSADRREIFAPGVAILTALFEQLSIDSMTLSRASLREGLLVGLQENLAGRDIREQAIDALLQRFSLDGVHAARVEATAAELWQQVATAWQLDEPLLKKYLLWAARLHELGLAINFQRLQKHSAYIARHADMPGFSQRQKRVLSWLLDNHRRRIVRPDPSLGNADLQVRLGRLLRILRLSVVLHLNRDDEIRYSPRLEVRGQELVLILPEQEWQASPLLRAELEEERILQSGIGWSLVIDPAARRDIPSPSEGAADSGSDKN